MANGRGREGQSYVLAHLPLGPKYSIADMEIVEVAEMTPDSV